MIELTEEMVEALRQNLSLERMETFEASLRPALEAVLRIVNAGGIPDEVMEVTDSDGDTWRRVPDQPELWELVGYAATAQHSGLRLLMEYDPLYWEGKS